MTPASKHRAAHLKRTYGITLEQYELLLLHQGGVCAVCGKSPRAGTNLTVDHEHGTGVAGSGGFIRGLLCHYCNLRIVGKHKNADLLRAAADYLDNPPAQEVLPRGHEVPKRKRQPRKKPRSKQQ